MPAVVDGLAARIGAGGFAIEGLDGTWPDELLVDLHSALRAAQIVIENNCGSDHGFCGADLRPALRLRSKPGLSHEAAPQMVHGLLAQ